MAAQQAGNGRSLYMHSLVCTLCLSCIAKVCKDPQFNHDYSPGQVASNRWNLCLDAQPHVPGSPVFIQRTGLTAGQWLDLIAYSFFDAVCSALYYQARGDLPYQCIWG